MTDREKNLFNALVDSEHIYLYRDHKVSSGGRKGKIMGEEEFKTILSNLCEKRGWDEDEFDMFYEGYFGKDQKVEFDFENIDDIDSGVLSCGVPWILYFAGGDWELPVYFFLYPDGKTGNPRMYIPTRGNVFHKDLKVAYGSLEEKMPDYSDDSDVPREAYRSIIAGSSLSSGYTAKEIENVATEFLREIENNEDYERYCLVDKLDYETDWMKEELEQRIEAV